MKLHEAKEFQVKERGRDKERGITENGIERNTKVHPNCLNSYSKISCPVLCLMSLRVLP